MISVRLRLAIQLALSLAVLAWVPGNALKLGAFVVVWALTFDKVSRREAVAFVAISALFSLMDIAAVHQGVFRFQNPDFFGLPVWEFVMWGFYVLHVIRFVDGPAPALARRTGALAALFAIPFMTLTDSNLLLFASAVTLSIVVAFFHERDDLYYGCYMMFVGAFVEYTGTLSGQWSYANAHPGGVSFWFLTMWGGIGIFVRRLVYPLVTKANRP